jgi:type 1 glutamine amidotransferase
VEAGKGWVGIHAAGCAQASWPWFMDLMGGVTWSRHAELRTGTLLFEDRDHPATAGMPASLSIKDEWYQFSKSPRAGVRVLAKADEAVYSRDPADKDHPLIWTQPDFAKALYIGIGHDPGDWSVPAYVSLVRDALLWAGPGTTGIISRESVRPDGRPRLEFRDGVLRIGTGSGMADARGRPALYLDQ